MIKPVIRVLSENKWRVSSWALGFASLLGTISFVGQWINQGLDNIRVQGVVAPSIIGSVLGTIIIYFVIRNRQLLEDQNRLLLEKIKTEQGYSSSLLNEISERKEVESALRESEARYGELIAGSALGIQIGSRRSGRLFANRACAKLFGYDPLEELLDLPSRGTVAEYDRERVREISLALLDGGDVSLTYEFDGLRKDGSIIPIQAFMQRIVWNGEDAVQRTFIDLTDKKQAEEQLRQAQKMEAIGQLTGGVAHDFNNLLMVIQGNAELLAADGDDESERHSRAILRASARGAELTQRLLAYSRRQPLQPRAIDLATLATNMRDLLVRTLGGTIDVDITTSPGLWTASADPGQVENALLNLAINARDAMQGGGRLTIGCGNARLDDRFTADNPEVVAGNYVLLAVGDTGTGMSPDVIKHAFEPFFTTKEVGEGSGLGLSMVYGFANQSGGCVVLDSEEGSGTTVKLYLPRAEGITEAETKNTNKGMPHGSGENVLVIEDDDAVRALSVNMLEILGYRAIDVPDAAKARLVLEGKEKIDLILSDVALPGGTSGLEFADEAVARNPDIRIVLMSGYPAGSSVGNDILSSNNILLTKPFELNRLATAMREAFD